MRIAVVSDLPQFVTGGAEIQAMRLIEMWLEQDHEIVCLGRRMGRRSVSIAGRNIKTHRIYTTSLFGRAGRAASYALSLTWLLLRLRNRIDVIYTRFLGEGATIAALLKRLGLLKVPLIATPANTGGHGDAHFLKTVPFSPAIIRLLDDQCDAINLIAGGLAPELKAIGFSGKNFTDIPNGIRIQPINRRHSEPVTRFIAIGRLTAQKGYDILLCALAQIRTHLQPNQVVIIGDGPDMSHLKSMANSLGLSSYIYWAGELNQQAIHNELQRAQVYLLPSRYEGMSNAALEAMESGLSVILTSCGGLDRYITPDMGWIVQPEDVQALADAILSAMREHHDTLLSRGERCREMVKNFFDIETTSRHYISLFKTLQRQNYAKESAKQWKF